MKRNPNVNARGLTPFTGVGVFTNSVHELANLELPVRTWQYNNSEGRAKMGALAALNQVRNALIGADTVNPVWEAYKDVYRDEVSFYQAFGFEWEWGNESKVYPELLELSQ